MPAWREGDWRVALLYRDTGPRPTRATLARAVTREEVLQDPVMAELLYWAAHRRPQSYELAAIAAALAALGQGLADGTPEACDVAVRVISAVDRARRLRYFPVSDRAMLADLDQVAEAVPEVSWVRPSVTSLVLPHLLAQAGGALSVDAVLLRRVEAAVDVFLASWLADAEAGGGLPEFRRAEERSQ